MSTQIQIVTQIMHQHLAVKINAFVLWKNLFIVLDPD